MIHLYHGTGSWEIELQGAAMDPEAWEGLKRRTMRLLTARKQRKAVDVLEKVPFQLSNGTNYFGDEFTVLHVTVDVERYTRFEELKSKPDYANAFTQIATTISEIGPYVRFIAVYLEQDDAPAPVPAPSLLISSASVERALEDATLLLRSAGAPSAVDRVHTALDGYLRAACERAGIAVPTSASIAAIFKHLRSEHPALAPPLCQ